MRDVSQSNFFGLPSFYSVPRVYHFCSLNGTQVLVTKFRAVLIQSSYLCIYLFLILLLISNHSINFLGVQTIFECITQTRMDVLLVTSLFSVPVIKP